MWNRYPIAYYQFTMDKDIVMMFQKLSNKRTVMAFSFYCNYYNVVNVEHNNTKIPYISCIKVNGSSVLLALASNDCKLLSL